MWLREPMLWENTRGVWEENLLLLEALPLGIVFFGYHGLMGSSHNQGGVNLDENPV